MPTRGLLVEEIELLQVIDQGVPRELGERYAALIARRRAGTLTPVEHAELLRLTDEVEVVEARRVEHLGKLARVRGASLEALMASLGIRAPEFE